MRIGFDAKRLFTNFTGLGNYSRNIVRHFHQVYPEDELSLFTPSIRENSRTNPFSEDSSYKIIVPSGFKPLWRSLDIVKDISISGIQVYHGLSHELPLGLSKLDIGKVVTIHDLIFKYYPQDYTWIDRQIYDGKWKHACHMSDVIIAISEQTKTDLIRYYNIQPDKIKVIYQAADPIFSNPVVDDDILTVRKKYHLPHSYNLYVGSVISRKNLLSIIKAIIIMKESERTPLVIIGQGKEYKKKVIEEAIRGGVEPLLIWLGSPPFEDFPAIYKGAQMMIYPSFHEGFGLPVVEAMQVGIPVITSFQSSLKEAGGDAARLIDPALPEELSEAMIMIATDVELSKNMVASGFKNILKFEAAGNISQLKKAYNSLI